jgi:hypothetical protein
LWGFEPQTFRDDDLKLKQSKHIRLFHNIDTTLFIILYNHYLSKKFKINKSGAEIKISNLNNYMVFCYQNGKDITICKPKNTKWVVSM